MSGGLSGALEDNVLCVLCHNDVHAPTVMQRVSPRLFSDRPHRAIAEAAHAYITRYHEAPKGHIRDLLEARLNRGDEGRMLWRIIEAMEDLQRALNATFVIEQLDNWIEARTLATAAEKTLELLGNGRLAEARDAMYQARRSIVPDSAGIWLADADAMLRFLEKDDEFFSSGIGVLDTHEVRPSRKRMMILIAAAKAGKTWFLVQCGKYNIQHRHTVLHVSLEVPAEEVAQRYVQALFSLSRHDGKTVQTSKFIKDDLGQFVSLDTDTWLPETLSAANRPAVAAKLKSMAMRPRLLIKDFPSGTLTVPQLAAYLDGLALQHSFRPDLLIVDYPDLMRISSENLRIDTGRTFVELRGIAGSYNLALVAVTQGNRESATAETVRGRHVAEDWSKIGTADTVLTFSRTARERERGLARVGVEAARGAEDGYSVLIAQNYHVGQFCLDSVRMTPQVRQEVERETGDGEAKK